ncbi:GINS complex subunit [Serendipita sp. 400]|nr:GINS complex subunit [Serendipita sp. 400]
MALSLSDDESGPRLNRRPRPTDTSLFSSELPSFDTNIRSNDSYANARGAVGETSFRSEANNFVDPEDEELYGEGEETKVRELMRRWMDERLSPDLLTWQGELVSEILERLQSQNEIATQLQGNATTTEEEHFAVMLVQTEVERIKFVLRSYLRCRLQKIEKFTPFILATPEVQRNLSELEQNYVQRFGDLLGRHFMQSTLSNLPAHMHSLADENPNMPSMITEPTKSMAVFFRVREDDCPPLVLPDGKRIDLPKGSIHLAQYQYLETLLRREMVELV